MELRGKQKKSILLTFPKKISNLSPVGNPKYPRHQHFFLVDLKKLFGFVMFIKENFEYKLK